MGMVTLSKRENVEVFPFNSCRVFRQNSVIPQARSTTIALPVTKSKLKIRSHTKTRTKNYNISTILKSGQQKKEIQKKGKGGIVKGGIGRNRERERE